MIPAIPTKRTSVTSMVYFCGCSTSLNRRVCLCNTRGVLVLSSCGCSFWLPSLVYPYSFRITALHLWLSGGFSLLEGFSVCLADIGAALPTSGAGVS